MDLMFELTRNDVAREQMRPERTRWTWTALLFVVYWFLVLFSNLIARATGYPVNGLTYVALAASFAVSLPYWLPVISFVQYFTIIFFTLYCADPRFSQS